MELKDDFFKIESTNTTENSIKYVIRLNPEHYIYKAHFPGNPVTPGVCIIQIVKELSECKLETSLFIKEIARVKFKNVINPVDNALIDIRLELIKESENRYKAIAEVFNDNSIFATLDILFEKGDIV